MLRMVFQPRENGYDLFACQNHWNVPRFSSPADVFELSEIFLQNLSEEKDESIERLILGAGAHIPLERQVRKKTFDLRLPHFFRVSSVMIADEPSDPSDVALLSVIAEMAKANLLSNDIEKHARCRILQRRGGVIFRIAHERQIGKSRKEFPVVSYPVWSVRRSSQPVRYPVERKKDQMI